MSTPNQKRSKRSATHTLDQLLLCWTFGAVSAGMLLYSLIEYIIERPPDPVDFITHHLFHVLAIAVLVWGALVFIIRRAVVKPATMIFMHITRLSTGRLDYLESEEISQEMSEVVTSINILIGRLRRISDPDAASRAMDRARELRELIRKQGDHLGGDVVPAMKILTSLEGELLDLVQLSGTGASANQLG